MSEEHVLVERKTEPRLLGFALLVGALGLATVSAVVLLGQNPLFALLPLLGFLLLFALLKLPLRVPLLAMMFVGLTFENPGDVPAEGQWQTPLYPIGKLLLAQLKHSFGSGALVMTGTDLILVFLVGIYFARRIAGSRVDLKAAVPTPRPLITAALVCIGTALVMWGWGLVRGGANRFALWQFHHVVYLPFVFLFMQAVLSPAHSRTIARLIVVCACIKSVMAVYVRQMFPEAQYATTHHDAMLMAMATCMLVAQFVEQPKLRNLGKLALILPLLIAGMIANDRRLVYPEIGLSLIFMFALYRRTKFKVAIVRAMLVSLPLWIGYVAVGWSSGSGVFAPVGTIRSMVDSEVDKSSEWRDLENFNLVATVKSHPLTGTGWGHPFEEAVKLPDVMSEYELEPYLPHNSVVGLWAYTGYVGFTLLWAMLAVTCYFAARAYRYARDPGDRMAALSCFAMIVIYMVHAYGDMALGSWVSIYLVAAAMTLAGKLAVKVGAWPALRVPSAAGSRAMERVKPAPQVRF